MATNTLPEWGDMQGIVLSAYPGLDAAEYLPLRIEDAARTRDWLRRMADHVTTAAERRSDTNEAFARRLGLDIHLNVNIAISCTGLVKLYDVNDRDRDSFLYAFTEGVAGNVHRSRILGDTGANDPDHWDWGGDWKPVDVLLMVFAKTEADLPRAVDEALLSSGMARVPTHPLKALSVKAADGREHFGFVDGKSQPILTGTVDAERYPNSIHLTELGEFVFGYPDDGHTVAEGPKLGGWEEFGKNGTYLVFRQLEQDVAGFWKFMYEKTRSPSGTEDPIAAAELASKIVGRRQQDNGTPLVPYGHPDDNEFDFSDDPHGYGCPVSAHIRRANPRGSLSAEPLPRDQANRHRILRRARSYGPKLKDPRHDDRTKRGLLFMALNSDFERQFEFINQNWVNNPGFSGLAYERDPLVGGKDPHHRSQFTIPGLPARTRIEGVPRFVTVKGGEYFFLPGIRALKHLGGGV